MNFRTFSRLAAVITLLLLTACVSNRSDDDFLRFPPENPSPIDGATEIGLTPTLSWNCSHPDRLPLSYEIYLGPEGGPMILISDHQTANYYTFATPLLSDTLYYWRVVAWDTAGRYDTHPVWKFTTVDESQLSEVGSGLPQAQLSAP